MLRSRIIRRRWDCSLGKESHLNGEAEAENVLQHQLARGSSDPIVGYEKSFNFEADDDYGLRRRPNRREPFEPMELTNDAVIKVIGVGGGGGHAVEHMA